MRAAAGQVLHAMRRLLGLLLGLVLLLLLGAGAGAWRLGQGPVEVPALARQIEQQAAAAGGPRLEIGRAGIGWRGWQEGHLTPVEILLSGVRVLDAAGFVKAELPDAALSLSLPWLLRGELAPRVLELRQPSLRARRDAEGRLGFDLGAGTGGAAPQPGGPVPFQDLLAEMMRPPSEATPLGALERIRVSGGRLVVEDAGLGQSWTLEDPQIELRRLPGGGIAAEARAALAVDGQTVPLAASAEVVGQPARVSFRAGTGEVHPAPLARLAPALAPLSALDAPVRVQLAGRLDGDGRVEEAQASLLAGEGHLDLGAGRRIPIAALQAEATATPAALRLDRAVLRLAPAAPGRTAPSLTAQAGATRQGEAWRAEGVLRLDAVGFADLPRYWPEGLGSGERAWILANVTAGEVRDGNWRFGAEAPAADPAAIRLTSLEGTARAVDATVHWLRPIPPAERANGTASFSLSEVAIRVDSGRQGGVAVRDGTVRLTFPDGAVPQAEIALGLAGPVTEVLAVVAHPRLRLFERRPLPVKDPAGQLEGRLNIGFPLLADLPVEQLRVRAQSRLREVRLADILAGRPLERGAFDLTVTNEGLRANGTGILAGIQGRLGVEMDFRPGPANQVVMRETVQARADALEIAALGLPLDEVARGPVALDVRTERRRTGPARAFIRGDLREAAMEFAPLAWTKPAGQHAGAEAVLRLDGDELEVVESFRVEAPSLSLRGTAEFGRGARLQRVTIAEAAVEASRFGGEVRPPPQPGGYWGVTLRGAALDLRRTLAAEGDAPPGATAPDPQGPPFSVDARFDRVLLGPGRELAAVEARVAVDGRGVVRQGALAGRAGPRGRFEAQIEPMGAGRSLRATAEDAGALLSAFDVLQHLEGGRLAVQATYAGNQPGAPLSGTAEMSDFSVRNAPGFAKLLQAMTLYGLVEAVSGPGLGFSRLVAPFTLTPETLVLEEARAFSASLGLTAKGRLDRRRRRLDMAGTIVPAYVFNALLGNIPLLGRLFSPETGGGLFAATFRLQGPSEDPVVSVNPLAALTPGFLRGIFGLGQPAAGGAAPP